MNTTGIQDRHCRDGTVLSKIKVHHNREQNSVEREKIGKKPERPNQIDCSCLGIIIRFKLQLQF